MAAESLPVQTTSDCQNVAPKPSVATSVANAEATQSTAVTPEDHDVHRRSCSPSQPIVPRKDVDSHPLDVVVNALSAVRTQSSNRMGSNGLSLMLLNKDMVIYCENIHVLPLAYEKLRVERESSDISELEPQSSLLSDSRQPLSQDMYYQSLCQASDKHAESSVIGPYSGEVQSLGVAPIAATLAPCSTVHSVAIPHHAVPHPARASSAHLPAPVPPVHSSIASNTALAHSQHPSYANGTGESSEGKAPAQRKRLQFKMPTKRQAAVSAAVLVGTIALVKTARHCWNRYVAYRAARNCQISALRSSIVRPWRGQVTALNSLNKAVEDMNNAGGDTSKLAEGLAGDLLKLLHSSNSKVSVAAARLLRTLAFRHNTNARVLIKAGVVDALVDMVQGGRDTNYTDNIIARNTWTRLRPIQELSNRLWWLPLSWPQISMGLVSKVVTFVPRSRAYMSGPSEHWNHQPEQDNRCTAQKKEAAACALLNIAVTQEACKAVSQAPDAVRALVELLWTGTDIARTAAAEVLYNMLVKLPSLRNHFYSMGADVGLDFLFRTGNGVMRAAAIRALMTLNPGREPTAIDRGDTMMYQ